jgi:S-DNA-T family DNA segregation ATPase FtsK/SpoIIIE
VAKALTERSKPSRGTSARADAGASSPRRQRLWRDLALIVIAPLLLYLLACLASYSPDDPGFSNSGSVTGQVQNLGGLAGAWIADVLITLFGYAAFVLPLILGAVAWIALFGLGEEDELGPALRLVGIVGFLIAVTGLLHMRLLGVGGGGDPAHGGGVIGQLVGKSLSAGFGELGANLFLLVLLLVSITLATGLSWFWVMEKIGAGVLALPDLLRRKTRQAGEWKRSRDLREEREEVRKTEAVRQSRREPVRIEPPAAPVVEKSERAKRETQIPLFQGTGSTPDGLPPLALLDDPKPQTRSYSEETLETLSRQIEFKL